MADNGNQNRPVRTLTVENFSVIRKAKLVFGRITVLIGPEASGKSLLCKLANFLSGEIIGIAVEALLGRNSWDEFLQAAGREFNSRFQPASWLVGDFTVSFTSERYSVTARGPLGLDSRPGAEFAFSDSFQQLYVDTARDPVKQSPVFKSRGELQQDLWLEFSLLLNHQDARASLYIPSGRAFFVDPSRAISSLQNLTLDPITRRFAGQVTWDTRWKVGLMTAGRGTAQEIEKEMNRIARGSVADGGGKPVFLSPDGRAMPLSLLSSGTSELLPMFQVLDYLAWHQEHFYARAASASTPYISGYHPLIYLEEPEAHVFPETQRELVNLFAWMANDPVLSFDWVITTHSPYVLTAFNTLIEAWRVGNKKGKHNQVAAIVPEHSWVSEDDFAAYTIHDGVLKPIFKKEKTGAEGSGLIDGDYLDSVSDQLGNQFDRLLDIEYAE